MKQLKSLHFLLLVFVLFYRITSSNSEVVKHTWEVSYFPGAPDGVSKDKVLGINGQFPGPKIEAFVGDMLEVTVLNKIQDKQNLTIHWHGLHQKGFLFEDGTSQIAQCPLPQGSFQVYGFNLTHAGTFWYHSHVHSQYTEGLLGALIVHNRVEPYNYDGEVTLILSDWYHRTAFENEEWYPSPAQVSQSGYGGPASGGRPPYPDAALINGYGRYPCNFASFQNYSCALLQQKRQVFAVAQNSTIRVRIINGGALTFFNFSIDGHRLLPIEMDGIDVNSSVLVDVVSIAPGQRYSFLVKPPQPSTISFDDGRFLIRATVRKELLRDGENINPYPEALVNEVTSIIYRSIVDLPSDVIDVSTEVFTYLEILPPPLFQYSEEPGSITHLDEMGLLPLDGIPAPDYFDEEHILQSSTVVDEHGVSRAAFNSTPFILPKDKPLLFTLIDEGHLPPSAVPVEVKENNVVQIVFNNPFGNHPFHLHGHHFWLVGLGKSQDGSYDPAKHNLTTRAPLRDTVVLQANSYAVIRFVADNPGIWTVHCHLDWHNLAGMVATIVEGAETVKREVEITEEAERICRLHK